jgi:4-alpha-glucanotransferase
VTEIDHALVLNLHQPTGNLDQLLDDNEWEAHEILWALDRIPRSLWPNEDLARVHLAVSGTLLATLSDSRFQERVYGTIDCGALLWHLQNRRVIDVLGSAYYHPVLPLVPERDWPQQIERWRRIGGHLLGRDDVPGFWPPELAFTPRLIPHLRRAGYRWVIVDSEHVEAVTPMRWDELRYRPHIARHGDDEIIVVVRDRELSDAQESGMEVDWFLAEIAARTRHADSYVPLVVTATDGDNGGWFRNTTPGASFWSAFHDELMERVRAGASGGLRPAFVHGHLAGHAPYGEVTVREGAWNTGWHHGRDFTQWTGSERQRQALARVDALSARLDGALAADGHGDPMWDEAIHRLLQAQTSCNFYWGEAWVDRCHHDLDHVERLLAGSSA